MRFPEGRNLPILYSSISFWDVFNIAEGETLLFRFGLYAEGAEQRLMALMALALAARVLGMACVKKISSSLSQVLYYICIPVNYSCHWWWLNCLFNTMQKQNNTLEDTYC